MGAALAVSRKANSAARSTTSSSRSALLERYRRLREISRQQHSEILKLISGDAMLTQARRLGLAEGKTLVLDSLDELTFVFDLLIYTSSIVPTRAVDRYAKSQRLEPGTDEAILLHAKQQARFAIVECQQRHPVAGLVVKDLVRNCEYHLIDEGLEVSLPVGAMIATRLINIDDFVMTAGVMVMLQADFLRQVFSSAPLFQRKPAKELIDDRRLAEAIYRTAIAEEITDRIVYRDPHEHPVEVFSQKSRGVADQAA